MVWWDFGGGVGSPSPRGGCVVSLGDRCFLAAAGGRSVEDLTNSGKAPFGKTCFGRGASGARGQWVQERAVIDMLNNYAIGWMLRSKPTQLCSRKSRFMGAKRLNTHKCVARATVQIFYVCRIDRRRGVTVIGSLNPTPRVRDFNNRTNKRLRAQPNLFHLPKPFL